MLGPHKIWVNVNVPYALVSYQNFLLDASDLEVPHGELYLKLHLGTVKLDIEPLTQVVKGDNVCYPLLVVP